MYLIWYSIYRENLNTSIDFMTYRFLQIDSFHNRMLRSKKYLLNKNLRIASTKMYTEIFYNKKNTLDDLFFPIFLVNLKFSNSRFKKCLSPFFGPQS
jgi:hypothetical protein